MSPGLSALWARITKNADWSTGPLAHPFPCSLALLTRSLARHYLLAHFAHSRARGRVIDQMAIFSVFLDAPSHLYKSLCLSVGPVLFSKVKKTHIRRIRPRFLFWPIVGWYLETPFQSHSPDVTRSFCLPQTRTRCVSQSLISSDQKTRISFNI